MKYYYLIQEMKRGMTYTQPNVKSLLENKDLVALKNELFIIGGRESRIIINEKMYAVDKHYIDLTRSVTVYTLIESY